MTKEDNLRAFGPLPAVVIPEAARHFVALLKKRPKPERENVLEVRLFGSCARGEAKKDSDIDVMVVVRKLDSRAEHWIASVSEESMKAVGYKQLLSVFRVSAKHWKRHEELKSPLFLEVKRDGILLWPLSKS